MIRTHIVNALQGTVSVISSYPPCKDDNTRFTTVPLKVLKVLSAEE